MRQKTIKESFPLSGVGLHSGKATSIKVNPALEDQGIVFIKDGKKIPARIESVQDTCRGTFLDGIAVTEHFLAAAYGLGIDNLLVEIEGEELPALDGSALPYVEALLSAGILEQAAEKKYILLQHPITVSDGDSQIQAFPHDGFKVDFMVKFKGVGEESFSYAPPAVDFKTAIAPARTPGYLEEHAELKKQGLALGASFENALVLGEKGYVSEPRFSNEVVRHKILDLIGDLVLLGKPLKAAIRAQKSGHRLNLELVRRILKNDRT